jgi:hypothetical protein
MPWPWDQHVIFPLYTPVFENICPQEAEIGTNPQAKNLFLKLLILNP